MGYFSELAISLQERIAQECKMGFDTMDEMIEVFLDIASEFDVSPDVVWDTYKEGDWK